MLSRYSIVSFDKILRRVERKITLDDSEEYCCVGLKLYGKGPFIRETKEGALIKRKQQWILKTSDVVYNKLFAWKGTFAIANEAVNNCIVSDKFPTYCLDKTLVDPDFLALWFRTPHLADQAKNLSKGAAALSKLTLNPPDFWKLTIPLPDNLDEQRRVVGRVTGLLAACERIAVLRSPIDAVVQGRRAGVGSEVRLLMTAALRNLNEAMTYANLLMRMCVDSTQTHPRFVKYWIMSPLARKYVRENTKGTSPSVQKINQRALINMPFPADTQLHEQQQWVAYLDSIFDGVDRLEATMRGQYRNIEALVPSILDRAFRGEL